MGWRSRLGLGSWTNPPPALRGLYILGAAPQPMKEVARSSRDLGSRTECEPERCADNDPAPESGGCRTTSHEVWYPTTHEPAAATYTGIPHPAVPAPAGFLNLLTHYSTRNRLALFHASNAPGF